MRGPAFAALVAARLWHNRVVRRLALVCFLVVGCSGASLEVIQPVQRTRDIELTLQAGPGAEITRRRLTQLRDRVSDALRTTRTW